MKTNAFAYARAASVDEARRLYAEAGEGARYLAGGQSLMAALNFRLDEPSALIDLGGIAELCGIVRDGDLIRIGALTRHAQVLADPLIAAHLPLIAEAMRHVAHPAIRNRGTFGGSVALADPAAEMPACCLALGASMVIAGNGGTRHVPADDFFRGLYETALEPGEVLVAVEIPIPAPGAVHSFGELARRNGDYAMAGIAVMVGPGRRWARIAFFGLSDRAVRSPAAEAAVLAGEDPAAVATEGLDIYPDLNADEATKRHYAAVLLRRALAGLTQTGAAA
jgi:aerobic carbon-monoxide dehydrogenase medium subunit